MPTKCVDVFDRAGARVLSYSIALEEEGCLDAEFEEAALILAETSGTIAAEEIVHLRACCDSTAGVELADVQVPAAPRRSKSAVVSLVKHRMKRAGTLTRTGIRRVS